MRPALDVSLLPDAVAYFAAATPEHPAMVLGDQTYTYAEFDRRINQVGQMLLSAGVRKGDRVGVYAHKSLEVFVAMHGIMRAGAVYVPLNPDAPAGYIQHIVDDCGIEVLFVGKTTVRTAKAVAAGSDIRLCVGAQGEGDIPRFLSWDEVWSHPATEPEVEVTGDDLAYIIFTSGSTGRPKGIVHTHRSGLAYGKVAAQTFGFRPADRIANHPPLNFDLSLFELWGGIVAGATLVVVPEAHARLPASFSRLLQDQRVTIVNAVPFALVQLLHRGALDERDLSSLRMVAFGGEVYPTKDLRALMQRLPGAEFVNVYGPAEVNGVTYLVVPELAPDSHEPISIGSLYPGMEALVVDADGQPVPVGESGEMLINSPTRMVGYWNQPELTARTTHVSKGADGTSITWHRTGDLVQEQPDGSFTLIGRKDRLVKTRGHRVELDEVETALIGHDAVEQAVVFTVPDGEGSLQIEAVVTLYDAPTLDGGAPTEQDLLQFAARTLPRYALPRGLRIVQDVPRTSTGKADRVALTSQVSEASAQGKNPSIIHRHTHGAH